MDSRLRNTDGLLTVAQSGVNMEISDCDADRCVNTCLDTDGMRDTSPSGRSDRETETESSFRSQVENEGQFATIRCQILIIFELIYG